jgi:uroporphyrinogen decarboxylase
LERSADVNAKERFITTLTFKKHDRPLLWEFGYWTGTLRRWYGEGLPKQKGIIPETALDGETATAEIIPSPELNHPIDEDVHNYFSFDDGIKKLPINCWVYPPFERQIVNEELDTITYIDEFGITKKERKDGLSMPAFIDYPVKNEKDFSTISSRFDFKDSGRLEIGWREIVREYKKRDQIIALGGLPFGLFGGLRYLMGLERLCLSLYDNPAFISNVISFLTDFWINLFSVVLRQVEVDMIWFWEDMCYNRGPLISPEHFRMFILPSLIRLTSFFSDFGIKILVVDTDGDCSKIIPLLIEGGINTILPFEVQSNMDVVKIRKQYPKLGIIGGLDKKKIVYGRRYVDEELKYKLPVMFAQNGYIACADHLIPPDVSWDEFKYYRNRIGEYANASVKGVSA